MTSSTSPAAAAMIVRGPMAADHYTPIHNWILRGGLPAQYVGVYAYIASHREGWRLSEAQIAQALSKGRHYVRQARSAMEPQVCWCGVRRGGPTGTVWRGAVVGQ